MITIEEVAPRVGAWIETFMGLKFWMNVLVAPRVGAWIETCMNHQLKLKYMVAPRVGAWIETYFPSITCRWVWSRTSCRCVD